MSQRSEIYRDFREKLKSVGELAGQQSTNDLLKGIDQIWRSLIRVRSAMVKTLILQNKITSHAEVPSEDFSTLFLQIHNPKREARLCEHCCGLVEFQLNLCPYCGEQVNGQNSQGFINSITIDIKPNPKAPNWNIDYSGDVLLSEAARRAAETLPVIQPRGSTAEAFGGPSGHKQQRVHTNRSKMSRTADELLRWAKRRELLAALPYTPEQLAKLSQASLRSIVYALKLRATAEVASLPMADLIKIILANQPNTPPPPEPPPVGELPELEGNDE